MRSLFVFYFLAFYMVVNAQNINFPDPNFKNALVNSKCVDTNGDNIGDADADLNDDGEIDASEAMVIERLELINKSIQSLDGIVNFFNLSSLNCNYNKLTVLNVQGLTNLEYLDCGRNQLTSINVQGLINLTTLTCHTNKLTSLNVQGLTNLTNFFCVDNQLTSLNVQGLTNLTYFDCSYNQLTSLNVQGLTNLSSLECENNQLTFLNIQGLTNLEYLNCVRNQLTSLDLQGLTNLTKLECDNNQLTSLNVQGLTNLKYLYCSDNQLTSLNVQSLTNLSDFYCVYNKLISLDVQGLTNLSGLYCYNNQLTSLNIKGAKVADPYFNNNPTLKYICCNQDQITDIKAKALLNGQNCEVNSECSIINTSDFFKIINIYPNPVKDILYLDTHEQWTKAEIFDISGRIMRSFSMFGSSIDVGGLESGTYFMRVNNGEKVGMVKFVKI